MVAASVSLPVDAGQHGNTVGTVATVPNSRYSVRMPRREKDPDEMTSREGADLLGITLPRFYELVHDDKIRKHFPPFGKRAFYSRRELLALQQEELARRNQAKQSDTSEPSS